VRAQQDREAQRRPRGSQGTGRRRERRAPASPPASAAAPQAPNGSPPSTASEPASHPASQPAPAAALALPEASTEARAEAAPGKVPWAPIALTAATAVVAGAGALLGQLASQDYRAAQQAHFQSDRIRSLQATEQKAAAAKRPVHRRRRAGRGRARTFVW
jgi:hypothetical protein